MAHFEESLSGPENLSQKLKNSNYYSQVGDIKVKVDQCREGGIEIKIGNHRHTNGDNLENSNWVPNLSEIRKKLNSRDFSISSEFENVGLDNLPTPHCNCPACVTLMESLMSSILKQQTLAETSDPGKPCAEWTASALKNLNLNDHVDLSQIPPHALYEHIQSQYQQNQKKAGVPGITKDRPIPLSDKVENISPNIEGPQTASEKYPHINFKSCQRLTHTAPPDTSKEGPGDSPSLKRKSSSSVMVKIGTSHGSLTISSKKKIICQKTTEISTQTAQPETPPPAPVTKKEECVSEQKKTESEIKKAGCTGTHATEGCSEDHSEGSSKTKFCACCYCELVGHSGPQAPPNTHNYEQIKEKLRKKLEKRFPDKKDGKKKNDSEKDQKDLAPLDDRPVEDLMAFIEGDTEKEKKPKKKKKNKVQKEEKSSEESCSQSCADSKSSRKRNRTPDRWEQQQYEIEYHNLPPEPYVSPTSTPPAAHNPPQSSSPPDPTPSPPPAVPAKPVTPEPLDEFSEQLNKFRHLSQDKKLELLCNKKFERKLVENIYNYQQQLLRSIQVAKAEELKAAQEAELVEGEGGKKKNKKKKKRNETVDDIFMPRLDLDESDILDESERELEMFKKFCMDKEPKPQRQKIQLNIKNLSGKK